MRKTAVIHANAMVINRRGVLITGDSGSGKTQLCVALLKRGHRIIADDAVKLTLSNQQLIASAPARTFNWIALTPQTIESITQLFGNSALITQHRLHVHVHLDSFYHQTSRYSLTQSLLQLPIEPYTARDPAAFELLIQNRLNCPPNDWQEATC